MLECKISKFQSDFRIAAEFLRAKRLGNEKEIMYNSSKTWEHIEALMEFFHTFTSDKRYRDFKQHMINESQKGEVRMCSLLDACEKEVRYNSLEKLMKKTGMSLSEAMDALDFSDEEKSGYEQWKSDNKTTT